MQRVLQVLPALDSGGVEYYILDLMNALAKKHPDKTFYVVSAGGKLVGHFAPNIVHETLPLNKKNPFAFYRSLKGLEAICEKYSIERLHVHSRLPAWLCYFIAKKHNIPYSSTYHGIHGHKNALKKWYNTAMLRGDFVIAISRFVKNHLEDVYSLETENKIIEIFEGVDTEHFDPAQYSEQDRLDLYNQFNIPFFHKLIFMPGRFSKSKGHKILLEALVGLDDITVIFAGKHDEKNRYLQSLKKFCVQHNIDAKFFDTVEDVRLFYYSAHAVINNSQKPEAFGRVMAEALAMACNLIATNIGGAIELTKNGKFCSFIEPGNVEGLKDALKKCMDQTPRNLKAKKSMRQFIRQNYSFSTMISSYEKCIYKV